MINDFTNLINELTLPPNLKKEHYFSVKYIFIFI